MSANIVPLAVELCSWKKTTPERFELSHALHTALAGLRLNHSAKVPFLVTGMYCTFKELS